MTNGDSNPPRLGELLRRLVSTGVGALQNRGELFLVELQEENIRLAELIIWAMAGCLLAAMFVAMLTVTVIMLVPAEGRVWAAAGFCVLYLAGAVLALLNLKALVKTAPSPFAGTAAEIKKDCEWLESLK